MLSEEQLIADYFKPLDNIHGITPASLAIGDDAALLDIPVGKQLVISTDNLVAGVHFPENITAFDLGKRSLAINLSDLAAMGAQAAWFTLNLTMPDSNTQWLADFSKGLAALAKEFKCQLIGGNTSRGPLNIAISVYGLVPHGQAIRRDNAQIGDAIYVTGKLGNAAAGLQCLQQGIDTYPGLIQQFVNPVPRINCGLALSKVASSMLDISDGLDTDLTRLINASNVGAQLYLDKLPLDDALIDYCGLEQALQAALTGGDDYELCFTVPVHNIEILASKAAQIDVGYTCIGKITSGDTIDYMHNNIKIDMHLNKSFQHFN